MLFLENSNVFLNFFFNSSLSLIRKSLLQDEQLFCCPKVALSTFKFKKTVTDFTFKFVNSPRKIINKIR